MLEIDLFNISRFLSPHEIWFIASVCKRWNRIIKQPSVWTNREYASARNYKQFRKFSKRKLSGVNVILSPHAILADLAIPHTRLVYTMLKYNNAALLHTLYGSKFRYGSYVTVVSTCIVPKFFLNAKFTFISTCEVSETLFRSIFFKKTCKNRDPVEDILSCHKNHARTISGRAYNVSLGSAFVDGYMSTDQCVKCEINWGFISSLRQRHHFSTIEYMLDMEYIKLDSEEDFHWENMARIGGRNFLTLQFQPMISHVDYLCHLDASTSQRI